MHKKYTYIILYPLLLTSYLNANQGCNILSIIEETAPIEERTSTFKIREEKVKIKKETKKKIELKITEILTSITIVHENQKLRIKRTPRNQEHTCPPFCIQPMNIKGVTTVGELEVLNFIKELKGKEAKLLIDIRNSKQFKQHTIPGAINIPYHMLKTHSKYQDQVLTLLGGKKQEGKWIFKSVPSLLIFGASDENDTASKAINTLLKLSYPNKKIYYYRAGVEGWNHLRLTLY
jgi:hypothetical protein